MWALAGAVTGCGEETLRPADVVLEVGGGFRVTIVEGQRLVIRSADGRVLLDGLGAGPAAAEEPPPASFAVRDAVPHYEMQFGSFRPDHEPRNT